MGRAESGDGVDLLCQFRRLGLGERGLDHRKFVADGLDRELREVGLFKAAIFAWALALVGKMPATTSYFLVTAAALDGAFALTVIVVVVDLPVVGLVVVVAGVAVVVTASIPVPAADVNVGATAAIELATIAPMTMNRFTFELPFMFHVSLVTPARSSTS